MFFLSLNDNEAMNSIRRYSFGSFSIFNSFFTEFVHLFYNEDNILALKHKNAELMLENNLLRDYALQNLELKSLLKMQDTINTKIISAKVVSKLVSAVQGNLIINLGLNDGISKGMPVINDKGLVGIIQQTSDNYSLVRHIKNAHLKIAVKDQRSGIDGILHWDGNSLIISNIQGIDDVLIGDRIITSDFSSIFPPNIPIGIVKEKERNLTGFISLVIIEPFVNIEWLSHVYVLPIKRDPQIDSLKNLIKIKK
ncbi:MAG: rod shape-determining protein MreC [bacterium]